MAAEMMDGGVGAELQKKSTAWRTKRGSLAVIEGLE